MDLQQLRYFTAVANNGSISAAAVMLGVTQPTISQALQGLERELRTPLFSRIGRGMVLTSAGHALLPAARQVLRASAVAQATLPEDGTDVLGRLDVSITPTAMSGVVPGLIGAFLRQYDQVTVNVRTLPREADIAALLTEQVSDVVFVQLPFERPVGDGDVELECFSVGSEEIRVALPRGASTDPSRDLRKVRPVLAPRTVEFATALASHELTAVGDRVGPPVVTARRETRLALVAQGVGATFLPSKVAQVAERQGVQTQPVAPAADYRFGMVYDPETLSGAALAFVGLVRSWVPDTSDKNAFTAAGGRPLR